MLAYIKLQLIMNVRHGYIENGFPVLEINTVSCILHYRERNKVFILCRMRQHTMLVDPDGSKKKQKLIYVV